MTQRKTDPLDGLRETIAGHVGEVLRRHYGSEGANTIKSVQAAIRAAGKGEEKPAPVMEACADAAASKLLDRRGERDLGLATRIAGEARAAAGRWSKT